MPRGGSVLGIVLLSAITCGAGSACAARAPEGQTTSGAQAASVAQAARDTHERLNAVLWMQTAAEYWAGTVAAYAAAEQALDRALRDPSRTAAVEQTGDYQGLPPAVILDIDETVLDNSPLQAQLVLDRTDFAPRYWDEWVDLAGGKPLPGAVEFLDAAARRGVDVFFVTNRTAAEQDKTIQALAAAGIDARDANVLCTGESGWTSDKTARRAAVAATHRVLLLIGDDLNDFVATAKLTTDQRMQLASAHRQRWGREWIMIPNPVYGSWERALYPGVSGDAEILRRKRQQVRGFDARQIQ